MSNCPKRVVRKFSGPKGLQGWFPMIFMGCPMVFKGFESLLPPPRSPGSPRPSPGAPLAWKQTRNCQVPAAVPADQKAGTLFFTHSPTIYDQPAPIQLLRGVLKWGPQPSASKDRSWIPGGNPPQIIDIGGLARFLSLLLTRF